MGKSIGQAARRVGPVMRGLLIPRGALGMAWCRGSDGKPLPIHRPQDCGDERVLLHRPSQERGEAGAPKLVLVVVLGRDGDGRRARLVFSGLPNHPERIVTAEVRLADDIGLERGPW